MKASTSISTRPPSLLPFLFPSRLLQLPSSGRPRQSPSRCFVALPRLSTATAPFFWMLIVAVCFILSKASALLLRWAVSVACPLCVKLLLSRQANRLALSVLYGCLPGPGPHQADWRRHAWVWCLLTSDLLRPVVLREATWHSWRCILQKMYKCFELNSSFEHEKHKF